MNGPKWKRWGVLKKKSTESHKKQRYIDLNLRLILLPNAAAPFPCIFVTNSIIRLKPLKV